MNLPDLLQHYTLEFSSTDTYTQVKTRGGISPIDQAKLTELGWVKKNDQTFILLKPIFEPLEDEDEAVD